MRRVLALLLAIASLSTVVLREALPPRDISQRLAVLPLNVARSANGPFHLTGAWQLTSPDYRFGAYSALVVSGPGRLLALSDQGYLLDFAKPGAGGPAARIAGALPGRLVPKQQRDVEALVRDPASGELWLALEGRNAIARFGPGFAPLALVRPPAMQDWPGNGGPETMVRLADGRFLVIAEAYGGPFDWSQHPALLFEGDPTMPGAPAPEFFTFAGPSGYRPTDAALLPDGRVLVLMRQLVWPIPARFGAKLALLDPDAISAGGQVEATELAALDDPWPLDNYEGLALETGADDTITAWLISDGNNAVTQRTLLLRLSLRLADLPRKTKGARVAPRAFR